jgi:uncharacterized protein (DUF4415 family)
MSDEKLRDRKTDVADEENPEWTEADFARARPASKVLGTKAGAALVRGRGRPAKAPDERKRQVTMRLSPDVLKAARASGGGWQTRADAALRREFLGSDGIAARAPIKRLVSLHETMKHAVEAVKAAKGAKAKSPLIERSSGNGRTIGSGQSRKSGFGKKRA